MQSIRAATLRVARLFCIVRRAWLTVFMAAVVGLAGCRDKHEWHQKLTVVVDTPSGEVSGSSTIEVRAAFGKLPLSNNEVNYRITGEATVVGIAPGRYLIALLSGSKERYYRAAHDKLKNLDRGDWLHLIPEMETILTLEPNNYPLLVTFGDVKDPKSVRKVDPAHLSETFGPGYRLKKISLEITEESISDSRIENLLPWLKWSRDDLLKHGGGLNPVRFSENEIIRVLGRPEFRRR